MLLYVRCWVTVRNFAFEKYLKMFFIKSLCFPRKCDHYHLPQILVNEREKKDNIEVWLKGLTVSKTIQASKIQTGDVKIK